MAARAPGRDRRRRLGGAGGAWLQLRLPARRLAVAVLLQVLLVVHVAAVAGAGSGAASRFPGARGQEGLWRRGRAAPAHVLPRVARDVLSVATAGGGALGGGSVAAAADASGDGRPGKVLVAAGDVLPEGPRHAGVEGRELSLLIQLLITVVITIITIIMIMIIIEQQ